MIIVETTVAWTATDPGERWVGMAERGTLGSASHVLWLQLQGSIGGFERGGGVRMEGEGLGRLEGSRSVSVQLLQHLSCGDPVSPMHDTLSLCNLTQAWKT